MATIIFQTLTAAGTVKRFDSTTMTPDFAAFNLGAALMPVIQSGTGAGAYFDFGSRAIRTSFVPANAGDLVNKAFSDSAVAAEATARDAAILVETNARVSAISTEVTNRNSAIASEATARDTAILVETNRAVAAEALALPKTGGTMSGAIAMGAQKITGLLAGTTSTDAINLAQLQASAAGVSWKNPIQDPDLIDDSIAIPPGSPVAGGVYIAAGTSGAWTTGHAYFYNTVTTAWVDLLGRAVAVGDRFGVALEHGAGFLGGGLIGKQNHIVQIASLGPIVYTDYVPAVQDATFVNGVASLHFGHSYTYEATSTWIEFGGISALTAGIGLTLNGNVLSVNMGAGIGQLPTTEVGIDLYSASAMMLTVDGTTDSTLTNAQLSLRLDGVTLSKSATGVKVATGGINNNEINAAAAIAFSKMAALTANRAMITDASGILIPSAVTNVELGYLSGVISSVQTQIDGFKSLTNSSGVTINANDVVYINAAGTIAQATKAIANLNTFSLGYAPASILNTVAGNVQASHGKFLTGAGFTIGQEYFVSGTAGLVDLYANITWAVNDFVYSVGRAVSATQIAFDPQFKFQY